ncbi:MAG: hypothetical protein AAGC55_10605 [Myxococcota bacterium]
MKRRYVLLLLITLAACNKNSSNPAAGGTASPAPDPSAAQPQVDDPRCDRAIMGEESEVTLMGTERLGPIAFGNTVAEVRKALGEPERAASATEDDDPERPKRTFHYDSDGLTLQFIANSPDKPMALYLAEASAPSEHATRYGIAIGDTRDEVEAAYAECISERGEDWIIVGPDYSCLIFEFTDDRVAKIVLGDTTE